MRFLCDEGVDQQILLRLRSEGHHVISVREESPGATDEEVFERANREEAVLVTTDKDFGELVFRQRRVSHGVLLLRLAGLSQETKAETVAKAVDNHAQDLSGAFTVVSPGRIRIRPSGV